MAEQPFIYNMIVKCMHRQTNYPQKSNPRSIASGEEILSRDEQNQSTANLDFQDMVKITKVMLEYISSKNSSNMNPSEKRKFHSLVNGLLDLTDNITYSHEQKFRL